MPRRDLTDDQVHRIRTLGLSDAHWARVLVRSVGVIRAARVGDTYRQVATAPDQKARESGGRFAGPLARPARQQWNYYRE